MERALSAARTRSTGKKHFCDITPIRTRLLSIVSMPAAAFGDFTDRCDGFQLRDFYPEFLRPFDQMLPA